ncbi:hypothetical protein L218DRAFT_991932 [Marasmius fiardii PR-910]|nr:hypothetical protein L218DRAFT_991932 [Marasmius fiardii PR-910]
MNPEANWISNDETKNIPEEHPNPPRAVNRFPVGEIHHSVRNYSGIRSGTRVLFVASEKSLAIAFKFLWEFSVTWLRKRLFRNENRRDGGEKPNIIKPLLATVEIIWGKNENPNSVYVEFAKNTGCRDFTDGREPVKAGKISQEVPVTFHVESLSGTPTARKPGGNGTLQYIQRLYPRSKCLAGTWSAIPRSSGETNVSRAEMALTLTGFTIYPNKAMIHKHIKRALQKLLGREK